MTEQFNYGGFDFQLRARCTWGESETFERAGPGGAQRSRLRISLVARLSGQTAVEIDAQLALVRAALMTSGSELSVVNGAGEETLRLASAEILSRNVPEGWRHYTGEVTVEFEGTRTSGGSARGLSLVFHPLGQDEGVTFPNVEGGGESLSSTRYDDERAARRQARSVMSFKGRLYANAEDSPEARRTFLLSEKARMAAALNVPQGTIVFGGTTEEGVFVESGSSLELDGDLAESLSWSVSFSKVTFPDGNHAEVDFQVRATDNQESGESELTVSGSIRSHSLAGAEARAAQILAYWSIGRTLLRKTEGSRRASGAETATGLAGEFLSYDFSYSFVTALAGVLNWDYSVEVREDDRQGIVTRTYSGRVLATTFAAAQTKARALGDGKHPRRISRSEKANYEKKGATGTERFIRLDFSYIYEEPGSVLSARVTVSTTLERFGSGKLSVRGDVTATTAAQAATFAALFRQTGKLAVREETSPASEFLRPSADAGKGPEVFQRLSFGYEYLTGNTDATVIYSIRESVNVKERAKTLVVSGTAFGASSAAARAVISALLSTFTGRLENSSLEDNYQADALKTIYHSTQFSYQYHSLPAADGSILSARYAVSTTGSVNASVITPIPFDVAHVQRATGWTVGERTVAGSLRGYSRTALETWARSKKAAWKTGEEQPPQETWSVLYEDGGATVETEQELAFAYRWLDPGLRLPN